MSVPRSRALAVGVLVVALGVGAWLRFDGLSRAQPFLWDDAVHHLEGVFLRDLARFVDGSVERKLAEARGEGDLWTWDGERERFAREVGGIPLRHARPGHTLLTALALEATDDAPWSGALVAGVAGTLTLLVLFVWIARTPAPLGGPLAAAVAVAWLAVDPLHVRLSREGLADADGLLFALLAFAAYLRGRRPASGRLRWMMLAGLLTGIAFTVQTRNFLVVGAVLAWELLPGPWRHDASRRDRWLRAAGFLACAALPLVAVESIYYLAFLGGRAQGVVPPYRPYSLQVLVVFARHSGALEQYVAASKLANLASYPLLGREWTGSWWPVAVPAAAVAGLAGIAARHRSREAWVVIAWALGGALFLSLSVPLARYAAFVLPALAWAVGACTARCLEGAGRAGERGQPGGGRLSSRAPALAWAAALVVAAGLSYGAARAGVQEVRPGYRDAVEWMRSHGSVRHVSTQPFVSQIWVGAEDVLFLPGSENELRAAAEDGYRYVLIDYIRNFFLGAFEPRAERVRTIVDRCPRVAVLDNAWAARPEYLFEFNYDVKATMERVRRAREGHDGYAGIEIYDLEGCDAREEMR